ncbi:MAG TPA: hypothetical protein VJ830_02050 [Anaerolineales bacterium]|nr:hypothetical protein [Anaerolineales bacterium]
MTNQLPKPREEANSDSSIETEMCPKLKKKRMKIVEIRIVLGRLLINEKPTKERIAVIPMEKSKGRMMTLASTSRKFQVSNARLGYNVNRKIKKGYFFILSTTASKGKKARF